MTLKSQNIGKENLTQTQTHLKIKVTSKFTSKKFKSIINRKNPKTLVFESSDGWLNEKTFHFAQCLIDHKWKPTEVKFINKRNPKDRYLLKITLMNSNYENLADLPYSKMWSG